MLVYFGVTPTPISPTPILKFALPPTPTPDASQWNIGGVGPSGVGAGIGHVHFMLFMSISFASGTQRKLVFQWNMGYRNIHIIGPIPHNLLSITQSLPNENNNTNSRKAE